MTAERRNRWAFPIAVFVAAVSLPVLLAMTPGPRPFRLPTLPPPGKVYYGVQLSWGDTTVRQYARRLGHSPAIVGDYVDFPLARDRIQQLEHEAADARAVGAALMIAVMPKSGLQTVTPANVSGLAHAVARLSRYTTVFVRFGHEMNGPWYAWGQQPRAYVAAFRRVATAIHQAAPSAKMVWAPNEATGYPFPNGPFPPGGPRRVSSQMDTNHNGHLDTGDDPYAPYYPGDRYVDWVGLTIYHYGYRWPWTKNVLPEPGVFVAKIRGTYDGKGGDWRREPDFYEAYAVRHNKPFMAGETSALYTPQTHTGASNYAIKMAWAHQLFAANLPHRFPRLKAILWFEHDKYELGAGQTVLWSAVQNPRIRRGFRKALPPWFMFGGESN